MPDKADHEKTGIAISGTAVENLDLDKPSPAERQAAEAATKAKPKAEAAAPAADPSVLSDEEIDKLRKAARANVRKELRQAALKAQLEQFEREERVAAGIAEKKPLAQGRWPAYGRPPIAEEDKVMVTIALPPFADAIPVDGALFFDGHTYWVSPAEQASLIEQMQWSWQHQDLNQITSARDKYRQRTRQRDAHLMMGAVQPGVASRGMH